MQGECSEVRQMCARVRRVYRGRQVWAGVGRTGKGCGLVGVCELAAGMTRPWGGNESA